MPRLKEISPQFVEYMPEQIADGILYISRPFQIALHNCACGCGEEVSTPLTATEWKLALEGGAVSLYPSIGNHDFPCKSHYWIKRNKIIWSYEMTKDEIDVIREYDRYLKRGEQPAGRAAKISPQHKVAKRAHLLVRLSNFLRKLFG